MIHNISRFITALALLATAQWAWADTETVSYVDADGNAQTVTATVERSTTIDLSDANGDFNAIDGDVLTGTTSHTVTIANGANITLSGATITGGIVCEGTATITLDGTNIVNLNDASLAYSKAGIQIGGNGTTLTIRGDGSLTATGGSQAAGIGLGRTWDDNATGGSVVIEGGTVTASGSNGIGTGRVGNSKTATVGEIIIKGGTVNARLGKGEIVGSGSSANIGAIKIYDTIDMVDASKITETVTYMHVDGETATDVTASKTDYFTIGENGDRRIIVPKDDNDYNITIADGIEHGTLTVAETAKYMETVTVTATPAFGYRFVRLIVKDADGNDVASTVNTFQMPKGGATVSAVFEQGVHGTTEFAWAYLGLSDYVNEATIYDGVTTVNLQNTEVSYIILKYDEYTYSKFELDNNTYYANIPYAGGTGEFYGAGIGTSFMIPDDGETGYYDITLTDAGNGKWSVSILKTAAQMDVVPDQTYTGSAITPEPLVIAGSLSLTKGTDYTYSYTNNTNVGTATVTVTFQGDYESLGSVEKEFTIAPWSGTGDSEDDPYMIYNKDQLLLLAHRVNGTNGETANGYNGKYFKLGADITFSHDADEGDDYDENYEAIGGYTGGTYRNFKGNFDGDGHTVSGIRIRKDGSGTADIYQGLFGRIDSGASIYDVHLTDARIKGCQSVGGIVGYNVAGYIWRCSVTDSYITATGNANYGTICGRSDDTYRLRNNYYHGCTVNGTAVTSGKGCEGADIADYNGALPAYRLALGENITTPPGTFADQTGWLDTPPVDARLAPENGFTLAGNHYFASGYVFTPGSTLASGAAQGYTPRATLGDVLLALYTPTGDTDLLAGTAIAQFTVTADCDGKTLASTQAIYSTGQPVTVAYIKADGTPDEASAIALDGTETSLAAGWYFVGKDISYNATVTLSGNVNLILADGCAMNVGKSGSEVDGYGIICYDEANDTYYDLTICGQTAQTGTLSVYTTGQYHYAIGTRHITVNGGNVIAHTDGSGSGIDTKRSGNVTINRGSVSATTTDTGRWAWAICANGNLTINGGNVSAKSNSNAIQADGNVAITGGTVNATGGDGGYSGIYSNATITLGWSKPTDRISITASSYSGTVQVADGKKLHNGSDFLGGTLSDPAADINGKTLRPAATATYTTADGTAATADAILLDGSDNSLPAGNYLATGTLNYTHGITLAGNVTLILADNCHMNVGTSGERIEDKGIFGFSGGSHSITITSQSLGDDMGALSIYTKGSSKDGILANAITIDGGNVTADTNGDYAVALYAGGTDVTINGGNVNATTAGSDAYAIVAIGDFYYNGGNVTATAPNDYAYAIYAYGNYTFSWRTPADRITIGATGLYAPAGKTATFARLFTDGSGNYYGGTLTDLSALKDVTLTGTAAITLANDASNSDIITKATAIPGLTVTLADRTLYKDGAWNTLCLPFAVADFSGTIFEDATVMELDVEGMYDTDKQTGFDTATGTLYLYFKPAASILAGKPYIVKWESTGSVTDPTFPGVTISSTAPTAVEFDITGSSDKCQFVGQYSPFSITDANKNEIVMLGSGSKLGYSQNPRTLKCFRAHFYVPADPATGKSAARRFVLDFGDGDASGIESIEADGANGTNGVNGVNGANWYTLDGRRLNSKPAKPGIYVNNGRKVMIK